MAKFFDPICYQLFFIATSPEPMADFMRNWTQETMQDLAPYYLSYARQTKPYDMDLSLYGHCFTILPHNAEENLHRFLQELMEKPFVYASMGQSGKRPPDGLAVNLTGNEAKEQKECASFFLPKNISQVTVEKVQALCNCPDPMLRTVLFPVNNNPAWYRFLGFYFCCMPQNDGSFRHEAHICLPRVMLDQAGIAFPFQEKWVARLKDACSRFEHGHGVVKMDMTPLGSYFTSIVTGYLSDPCTSLLPGYGWGLCLSPAQADTLRQAGVLKKDHPFFKTESLPHGGLYLQLTDDVNRITREENQQMVDCLRPFLQPQKKKIMDLIPPSCRLALRPEDIVVDNNNFYLNLP